MPQGRRTSGRTWAGRIVALCVLAAAIGGVLAIVWAAGFLTSPAGPDGAGADTTPIASGPLTAGRQRICAWSRGNAAALERAAAARAIDEVDFDWYHSRADGSIAAEEENLARVRRAHTLRIVVMATITNRRNHASPFDARISGSILASAASRSAHIDRLVRLCTKKGFDGIDMDWEELPASDRGRFTAFIRELAHKLHANNRILSIAVYPKVAEPGSWGAQKAEDYARLGAAVDELKVMTYAFSGDWSAPGPQMPLHWAQQILEFAKSQVPAKKVYMGLPFFGFDWRAHSARYVLWRDVQATRHKHGGRLARDTASAEAILRYTDTSGTKHVVYFQDRRAVRTKVAWMKARQPGIAGTAIWVMGGEDPGFWSVLADELGPRP